MSEKICPKCKKMFANYVVVLSKHDDDSYFLHSCPLCRAELFYKKSRFSQAQRVLLIILLLPTFFFLMVFVTLLIDNFSASDFAGMYFMFFILIALFSALLLYITNNKFKEGLAQKYNTFHSNPKKEQKEIPGNVIYNQAIRTIKKDKKLPTEKNYVIKKTIIFFTISTSLILVLNIIFWQMANSSNPKIRKWAPKVFSQFVSLGDSDKINDLKYLNKLINNEIFLINYDNYPKSKKELKKRFKEDSWITDVIKINFDNIHYESNGNDYKICTETSTTTVCMSSNTD